MEKDILSEVLKTRLNRYFNVSPLLLCRLSDISVIRAVIYMYSDINLSDREINILVDNCKDSLEFLGYVRRVKNK